MMVMLVLLIAVILNVVVKLPPRYAMITTGVQGMVAIKKQDAPLMKLAVMTEMLVPMILVIRAPLIQDADTLVQTAMTKMPVLKIHVITLTDVNTTM
jgi:hypothetical protein